MKINLCSLGDATNPKTWSGTPFHIYTELRKQTKCNKAFSSGLSIKVEDLFSKLSKLIYLKSLNSEWASIQRVLRAQKIKRKGLEYSTLHLGTLDLPFILPPRQKQYLYCDSTFDLWSKNSTSLQNKNRIASYIAERLERKSYKQVRHIFTISEYVKKNLIEHYDISKDKITVAGTGLGVIRPYYGSKDYCNHKILFVAKGRFKDKGGELVLKAFKYVLEKIPDAKLTIVGQNDYTSFIKEKNVVTYGFISVEQLQNVFNTHSLFLMPAYNEPWGLVYLEAMACKMPIIGLNRNSFPEISDYGKYGYGLDEDNPQKLAQIIIEVFKKPEILEKIGLKAQQNCLMKYSWENVVKTIIDTIDVIEK